MVQKREEEAETEAYTAGLAEGIYLAELREPELDASQCRRGSSFRYHWRRPQDECRLCRSRNARDRWPRAAFALLHLSWRYLALRYARRPGSTALHIAQNLDLPGRKGLNLLSYPMLAPSSACGSPSGEPCPRKRNECPVWLAAR